MAKPLRPKRGTTAKNDAFTGLASEITIDTEKHSIRVHDGVTAGGHEILPKAKNDELYEVKGTTLPLGGGDVTGNLTVQGKNAVRSVNGVEADDNGDVPVAIPPAYELPTATSSVLGGVKIGSNITVSSGTISLSKSNVTSALGYTPLQTAPVTSVNGKTGAVTITAGNLSSSAYVANSYCKLSNGLQVVYGSYSSGDDTTKTITFARAFKSAPKIVMSCQASGASNLNGAEGVTSVSATQVKIYNGATVSVHWFAIGEGS